MRITVEHVSITKYSIPFLIPIEGGHLVLNCHKGLLATIKTNIVMKGVGGVCTLKSLHTERVSIALDKLRQFFIFHGQAGKSHIVCAT